MKRRRVVDLSSWSWAKVPPSAWQEMEFDHAALLESAVVELRAPASSDGMPLPWETGLMAVMFGGDSATCLPALELPELDWREAAVPPQRASSATEMSSFEVDKPPPAAVCGRTDFFAFPSGRKRQSEESRRAGLLGLFTALIAECGEGTGLWGKADAENPLEEVVE